LLRIFKRYSPFSHRLHKFFVACKPDFSTRKPAFLKCNNPTASHASALRSKTGNAALRTGSGLSHASHVLLLLPGLLLHDAANLLSHLLLGSS